METMVINTAAIMKSLGTFTNAYGLESNSKKLVEEIGNGSLRVKEIGIMLRDPISKAGLISCYFPVDVDITHEMLFVPVNGKTLEARPVCTREAKPGFQLKDLWKKLPDENLSDPDYYEIREGNFRLRVHHSFCKKGVIENYLPAQGYGFISRNRKGIFFLSRWCNFDRIWTGKEVSFIPIISRQGLQARAVQE